MPRVLPKNSIAAGRDGRRWRAVSWEGEVDLATLPAMLTRILLAGQPGYSVVVDMAAVEFMGLAGVGALVKARKRLRAIDRGTSRS